MIAIIDYGVGNLFSLRSSFAAIGEEAVVTADGQVLRDAGKIILPGVGAFGDASRKLRESGMADLLLREVKAGKPVLGICLGMQLLFDVSYEYGEYPGLGLIPGKIVPLKDAIDPALKVPHMGWNALHFLQPDCPLFRHTAEGEHVYFVHSYYASDCLPHTAAVTEYGGQITAAVAKDNVFGCQFHPEKSGKTGLGILKAFSEMRD